MLSKSSVKNINRTNESNQKHDELSKINIRGCRLDNYYTI